MATDPTSAPEDRDKTASSPESLPDKHLEALHEHRHEKKGARIAFHTVNFLGFHQIFNNVTSLVIAYSLMTTRAAGRMKEWLGGSMIGKAADAVFSLPGKTVDGVLKLFGRESKVLSEAEKALAAQHNARSSIETAFMCIAGFLALLPVKYLEDHRPGFLNKVDNWLHPGRSEKEKKAAALQPGDEPKETWWNLLRARFIGLFVVFSVDRMRQNFDNWRGYDKGNIDTAFGWKPGAWLYDHMSPGFRSKLANFFSRKGITLGSIQAETRDNLLHTIGAPEDLHQASAEIAPLQKQMFANFKDEALVGTLKTKIKAIEDGLKAAGHSSAVERAVFSEQWRMFLTKEVFLTTVISVTIYTCAKAPFMARFFEKIGLKKKEAKAEHSDTPHPKHGKSVSHSLVTEKEVEARESWRTHWGEREKAHALEMEKAADAPSR